MKRIAVLSVLLLVLGFAGAAQANFTVLYQYLPTYNPNSFTYYCSNPLVENFEDTTLISGLSIYENNTAGTISLGVYQNIVDQDANPPDYQEFSYTGGMFGFGGWFDLAGPNGPGSSIDIYADGNFVMNIPNSAAGEFYGFFSDTAFSVVKLVEGPGTFVERYAIVDLALCPVPLPPSALLLGSCLLGLMGLRLRKK